MNLVQRGFGGVLVGLMVLTACQPTQSSNNETTKTQDEDFVGCYGVQKGDPAQIKISQADTYVMQMKEPDGSWDQPEVLQSVELDKAWQSYASNGLSLQKTNIKATLARPDGVMIISRLKQGSAVNPLLDSTHIVALFGATNTIYRVPCDDVGVQLDAYQHASTTNTQGVQ